MKILITCYALNFSGSSTYALTLASELVRQKYSVDIFCLFREDTFHVKDKNINIFQKISDVKDKDYDVVLAQHNVVALVVRSIKPDVPMVFISHGVLPKKASLEYPPSIDINIQRYVAISEEVKNNLIRNGIEEHNIDVIRNFVDTKRFKIKRKIRKNPEDLLLLSNRYNKEFLKLLKKSCRKLNLKLHVLGKDKKSNNVEHHINKSDIIISLGRGVLESMSCGRAAIVLNNNKGDGIVTEDNYKEIRECNFSGRKFNKDYSDIEHVVEEISKYHFSMGEINRNIILEEFDSSRVVKNLLSSCQEAIDSFSYKEIHIPSRELMWFRQNIKEMYESNNWKIGVRIKNILRKLKILG